MLDLRISVWSDYLWDKTPEEQVTIFKSKGFDVMELSVEAGIALLSRGSNYEKTGREFRKYMEESGFDAPQGHLKLACDICAEQPQPLIDELKNWIELYSAAGVKNLVFHSGGFDHTLSRSELLKRRLFAFKQLMPLIEGTDVNLCLENLVTLIPHSDELLETIEAVGSKNMAICYDTGHLNIGNNWSYQETPEHFVGLCGKYIKALHIADNDSKTDQHLLPLAMDREEFEKHYTPRVNMYQLVRQLKDIGYKGLFNFEVPGECLCPLSLRLKKLEYIKMLGEYYLSLVD